MNKGSGTCLGFVLSSFSRLYGVERVRSNHDFLTIAQRWCEDHDNKCGIHLDDLRKVDKYFEQYYTQFYK